MEQELEAKRIRSPVQFTPGNPQFYQSLARLDLCGTTYPLPRFDGFLLEYLGGGGGGGFFSKLDLCHAYLEKSIHRGHF